MKYLNHNTIYEEYFKKQSGPTMQQIGLDSIADQTTETVLPHNDIDTVPAYPYPFHIFCSMNSISIVFEFPTQLFVYHERLTIPRYVKRKKGCYAKHLLLSDCPVGM
jgi:hypothetical protein